MLLSRPTLARLADNAGLTVFFDKIVETKPERIFADKLFSKV